MTELGKSLVFYNQYIAEMTRLYDEKNEIPEIEKRRDRKQIRKSVATVGHDAGTEARLLLEACINDTKLRLERKNATRLVPVRRPATVEKHWEIAFYVFTPRQRKDNKDTRQIGITLENVGLTPWVWSRGGTIAEERIRRLLAPGVACPDASKDDWFAGTVPLTTIPIPWSLAKDFTLSADGFIEQTRNVLEAITPTFIRKLIRANLNR